MLGFFALQFYNTTTGFTQAILLALRRQVAQSTQQNSLDQLGPQFLRKLPTFFNKLVQTHRHASKMRRRRYFSIFTFENHENAVTSALV